MSTSASERLKDLDDQVKSIEENELGFIRRNLRRYATGNSLIAWNLSSVITWLQALGIGFGLFGKQMVAILVANFPTATATAAKAWGVVTSAFGWAVSLATP